MTIHHDKMAYGRLARTSEELSEEKLAEMLKKLNETDGEESDGSAENTEKKKPDKRL